MDKRAEEFLSSIGNGAGNEYASYEQDTLDSYSQAKIRKIRKKRGPTVRYDINYEKLGMTKDGRKICETCKKPMEWNKVHICEGKK